MVSSRTNKSIKNLIYGILGMLIKMIVLFLSRSIFIKILGIEFNGLNSLFSNILSVLSLADLGFASAISYALYKPLKENDEEQVTAIMNYFSKVYRTVALFITIAGLICLPFIQNLVNEPIETLPFSLNEIRCYYLMFLLNTVCSYLLAYKRTLFTADQKVYIVNNSDNVSNVLMNILQILLLLLTKNYYAYLITMVLRTILTNMIITLLANKNYKFLNVYKKTIIAKPLKKEILGNVRAMILHKIGGVAIFGTISIVMSTFIGIVETGIYGNYALIVSTMNSLIMMIYTSLLAGIGNMCVEKDIEYQYSVYKRINYLFLMIGGMSFCCYVCLFNSFISVWIGEDSVFSLPVVIAISFSPYITCMRNATLLFEEAKGIFRQDRYKAIVEALFGIGLSIGLSYVWGVFGVVIGYTIASMLVALPVESYVCINKALHQSVLKRLLVIIVFTIFTFAVCAFIYYINSLILIEGVLGVVVKFIVTILLTIIIFMSFTCWTKEFRYYLNVLMSYIKRLIK